MGLTFLHPAFLLGALATAVPVIIHLIYRRRALVHPFPAVRFLLLADKRTARKFRLHQLLLLALRVLAILLLALLLARPRLVGTQAQAAAVLPPQASVILVDNSLSMQYRDGETSRLQRAQAVAARLIADLRPQDGAVVLPLLAATADSGPPPFFTSDKAQLQTQLSALQPSHAPVDMVAAWQQALTLLHAHPAPRRRLVLLSDFTVNGWENFHLTRLDVVPEQLELSFIRLGTPHRDANLVVEGVRLDAPPFIEGVPLDVTAVLRNRGPEAVRNLRVDLLVGQTKVGEQLVDLGPDEEVTVPFRMTAPAAGLHWGEVHLESDGFTDDDRWYFALRTATPARVLVVDGDPGTSLFDSEIFYVMSALQPAGALGHTLFHPTPVTWEGLSQERLSDYQVVVLCNVEALSPQVRKRLQQFVRNGGGLLFFAGNRIVPDRYNAMFYRADTLLLPLPLGAPVQHPETRPMRIGRVASTHEALSVFADTAELLRRGNFYRYLSSATDALQPDVEVLLAFEDGQPLLLEKRLGRGRVLVFTTTADRDWTDLPTRTAYVPLLHGMLGHLADLASASQRPQVAIPEPFVLAGREADRDATLRVKTPDGHDRVSPFTAAGSRLTARFTDYTVPGLYRLTTPRGPDLLAANATRTESNFEKLQPDDLQPRLNPLRLAFEEEQASGQVQAGTRLPIRELSAIFMMALVAVLIVENVCANRF